MKLTYKTVVSKIELMGHGDPHINVWLEAAQKRSHNQHEPEDFTYASIVVDDTPANRDAFALGRPITVTIGE